jgi:hypothetical protein
VKGLDREMETNERIDAALATLEQASLGQDQPPAIVRLAPPDNSAYLLGNRDGFVQLAIASLRAARGQDQSFKKVPWICEEDLDWGLLGLKYDSSAHMSLRPPQKWWGKLLSTVLLLALLLCLLVGLGAIGYGVIHLFSK